jgi:hypothetical protein
MRHQQPDHVRSAPAPHGVAEHAGGVRARLQKHPHRFHAVEVERMGEPVGRVAVMLEQQRKTGGIAGFHRVIDGFAVVGVRAPASSSSRVMPGECTTPAAPYSPLIAPYSFSKHAFGSAPRASNDAHNSTGAKQECVT